MDEFTRKAPRISLKIVLDIHHYSTPTDRAEYVLAQRLLLPTREV